MESNYFKELIRSKAYEIGLSAAGFAKSDVLTEEINLFNKWLSNKFNADMAWLERNSDKREDINLILENVRSVIVVGLNYYSDYKYTDEPGYGKISRYAWGDDYHDVLLKKIESLSDFISSINPEIKNKCYVDTGPILEKQWAVKAGLGWQGKNSLILSKALGSYFFIGIILSTLEFDSDNIIPGHCGKCSACISACPTEAIIEPKVVDSNKCISYWTIEAKSNKNLPEHIKNNLNGWLYGCDICQEVCPWNKKVRNTNEVRFEPRNNESSLSVKPTSTFNRVTFSNPVI